MKAKKSLGQNFLHAKRFIHQAIAAMDITSADTIVEIGPGKGALTTEILAAEPQKLIAIEADKRMVEYLHERFSDEIENGMLEIIHNDVLEIDIAKTIPIPYKLIGNLPFYITGAIFRKFLSDAHQPINMTAITQKEVAERIAARDNKESILSLSVQAYGTPKYLAKIPKRSFNPAPKVDAALLHISNISRDNFDNKKHEELFFQLIKAGFAHKRKTLVNNLSIRYPKELLHEFLIKNNLELTTRAEDVPLHIWLGFPHATTQ